MVSKYLNRGESIVTNVTEYSDYIGASLDWQKEARKLKQRRRLIMVGIVLLFLIASLLMLLSVLKIEGQKIETDEKFQLRKLNTTN